MQSKSIIKGSAIVIFVLVLYSFHQRLFHISPEDLRTFIFMAGWLAPLFYLILFTLRPLTLFPASIFSIVGGLAFGAILGSLLAWTGATLGAVLAFLISRRLGEDKFKHLKNKKVNELKNKFEEKGFLYILALRFLPIVNFDLISYGAGLSEVRLIDFTKATVIGIIPGTLIYNFMGASLVEGNKWTMMIVGIGYAIIVLVPVLWKRNIMKRIDQVNSKHTEG
ncbi:TVP38/TMEM64 family protein [Filobacillus milosensis]|uniref:TVP38/TMEM64 family membrane protein n=1 Tax=Filobacillus milosensis TaxID=94137 RepID=A0A4Y8IED7_9BACI|nr:TVP38/TMEM64 family protein [Filobacillus milosensis]TFB13163.1 TVP38/TMEM64 family protein [Filobacillus milosensis]